ncbi:MAG: hypothetical protein WC856_13170 [Methylococcaceae bacterium]
MKLTSVVESWNVNTGKNTPVTMSLLTIPPPYNPANYTASRVIMADNPVLANYPAAN